MEFPHELKELYPNQIIEVRGNADALTIILNSDVNIHQFMAELITKFSGLEEQQTLFIKHEDKQDFEKLILE
ncbi:hypothetical protein OQX63_06515 [Pedobacter sp. PF22-3]|uniref:hypothetical protein n=1 Tax=Pedobacter sp. PF22-3 TaxID=2994467 RepID=UPI002247619D|nr:hypothetical protein [Pedobacter sp. PF22-3]MCX2493118.1 hypothetical protein [Pedobacter sp. PF22-3]